LQQQVHALCTGADNSVDSLCELEAHLLQVRSVSGCLPDSMTAASPRQAASLPSQLHYSRIAAAGVGGGALPAKAHSAAAVPEAPPPDAEMSALHFFGVFDGHGGAEAALLCARTLHERLAEALHSGSAALSSQQVCIQHHLAATQHVRHDVYIACLS
jgi:Protein phosphatase 2C